MTGAIDKGRPGCAAAAIEVIANARLAAGHGTTREEAAYLTDKMIINKLFLLTRMDGKAIVSALMEKERQRKLRYAMYDLRAWDDRRSQNRGRA
jgi:hypothetical protein